MTKITIGQSDAGPVRLDADRLIESKLLITASSGGGKSWLLRKVLEGVSAKNQTIVIDTEGEFATLREKRDMVLAGPAGEVPAEVRAAGLLCRRLMEMNLSAVVDISELGLGNKRRFVSLFCQTMVDLPRSLWRPCFVCIDESHEFCLSSDTEVLTDGGWVRFSEMTTHMNVVCFDPKTGGYEYGKPSRVISRPYTGKMVRLKSDGIDCLMTPDHRAVIQRTQRAPGRYGKKYDWAFVQANKLPQQFHVPIGGGPSAAGTNVSLDLCRLIGLIATDGSFANNRRSLGIEQSYNTIKGGVPVVGYIRDVLTHANVKFSEYTRAPRPITHLPNRSNGRGKTASFYISRESSKSLIEYMGGEIHRIPRSLLQYGSPEQLQAILDGLLYGDGTTHPNDVAWKTFYPGLDGGLADDFQEVATRLGISTVKKLCPQNGQWRVHISRRDRHSIRRATDEEFNGTVCCITVRTGAFVARRNGKVFVTGNCPEGERCESTEAVASLGSKGRKRGYCLLLATQRLAKLNKDVAAECRNQFVGMLNLDVDLKRASDILGFGRDRWTELRDLSPPGKEGEFFGFGPAFEARGVIKLRAGQVETTHPRAGQGRLAAPPAPSAKIKGVIGELADLAKKADEEARTLAEAQKQIAGLRRELAAAKRPVATGGPQKAVAGDLEKARAAGQAEAQRAAAATEAGMRREIAALQRQVSRAAKAAAGVTAILGGAESMGIAHTLAASPLPAATNGRCRNDPAPQRAAAQPRIVPAAPKVKSIVRGDDGTLGKCERAILAVLAQYPEGCTADKLTLLAGYRYSGGFKNSLTNLRNAGLMEGENTSVMRITEAGHEQGPFPSLPVGDALRSYWLNHPSLGKCEREVLAVLLQNPDGLDAASICNQTGYQYSGGFKNALTNLRKAGVMIGKNTETMRATDDLLN